MIIITAIFACIIFFVLYKVSKKARKPDFVAGLAATMLVFLGIFRTNIPKNKHEISQTGRAKKDEKKSKL